MKLLDIINNPWAITPATLQEIVAIYCTHLRGEKIDLKGIEARLGQPLNNESKGYEIVNGIAVLPVEGVIAKRMNMFTRISGGVSTQLLARDFRQPLADPAVRGIIMAIDSPGGEVDGTQILTDIIFHARGRKPVVSLVNGLMASAAYWFGSATDSIYISSDTDMTGSLGVVATHVDVSQAEKMAGYKTTEITAGKYKRIASEYEPLSDEGRATIQKEVDYLYSVFVDAVARNRGVDVETVLSDMADGRVFIGRQAITAGLVDGVATLDQLIAEMAEGKLPAKSAAVIVSVTDDIGDPQKMQQLILESAGVADTTKEDIMTKDELKAKFPDVYKAVYDDGFRAGEEKGQEQTECPEHCIEKSKQEGAASELARIKAVKEQSVPGHEALVEALMFDGKTTGEQAAVNILAAGKQLRTGKYEAYLKDGKQINEPMGDPGSGKPKHRADDKSLPVEERARKEWDEKAEIRAEFGDFNTYLAYLDATEKGLVKVQRKEQK